MGTSIGNQAAAAHGAVTTGQTIDWTTLSLGWLEPEIIIDVPGIQDPLDFERVIEVAEESVLIPVADVAPTASDLDQRSELMTSGLGLVATSGSENRAEPTLHATRSFESHWVSSLGGAISQTPHGALLDAVPAVHAQSGGIFGLDDDTDVSGTEWDDVFYEINYFASDNMPDGWAFGPSHFWGEGGDDIFYTVDGLGYRGVDTDILVDVFNGGAGTDTVSYIRANVGAAINLEAGIGYRFGQNWNHPNPTWAERDSLISIENATGSHHADRIRGNWEDNVLHGLGGNDVMWGGLGDDTMRGGAGDDAMRGEDHDDLMYGDEGKDRLWGGAGDDEIHGGGDDDSASGGIGDDRIYGDGGDDKLHGNEGADTIYGGEGDDTIDGGSGDDELHGGGGDNSIRGGWGEDRITLGDGGEAWGDQGDDVIHGSNARDLIHGGAHDDTLFGWGGNDEMSGGSGDDTMYGGDGFDTASYQDAGGSVTVLLSWDGGFAFGAAGNDQLFSIESVVGSDFGDLISGNDAFNTLLGGGGNDIVAGNGGVDIIYGEGGDDDLRGGSGDDIVLGGEGNDRIRGGDGLDELTGGTGADSFVFVGGDSGADTITDFELGTDRIVFDDFLANAPGVGDDYVGEVYAFFADQPGDSALMARANEGWVHIATFEGVGLTALSDAIADGSLFYGHSEGLGGGPGGWAPVSGDHLPVSLGEELMFG
ncbi:calcium-binding protein [uncultured Roseobacter sp.]|uniref:calcium-binding protein n=1 Tax=uncultured Roseobacter sp. TaxID=114847 RepID=UPI0026225862|nr:calcium-binding protein [uncultured Roseobacter sp.]